MFRPPPPLKPAARASKRGFTLIELSIVLVIIGLVIGGVMVGQELIRSAEFRSMGSQIEQFRTAVNTFKTKYNCLPGDCQSATAFFPADPSCSGTGTRSAMAASNGLTCNGNGNGGIYTDNDEPVLFWQHLSLAGLIPGGPYTGSNAGSLNEVNAPAPPIKPTNTTNRPPASVYKIINPDVRYPDISYLNYFVPQNGSHVFWLSGYKASGGNTNGGPWTGWADPALSGDNLSLLDAKFDDGRPASGNITGGYAAMYGSGNRTTANACYNGSLTPPAYYAIGTAGVVGCAPMFKAGF